MRRSPPRLLRRAGEEEAVRDLSVADETGQWLRCAACNHAIARDDARIEVAGAHRHTCVNPAGFVFRIGSFGAAPGLEGQGEHVAEHSWFAGTSWQIAVCASCGVHLGWRFRPVGDGGRPFAGLVLDRLVEE